MTLSTAANPSPFDPLDRMPETEGRFVIREKDPAGPCAMTAWAAARRMWSIRTYGIDATGDAKRLLDAELLQCREAEELALEWKEIQSGGAAFDGPKASYNDIILTEEQLAAAKRQKDMAELTRHLREAAFHAAEITEADGADELECFAPVLASLNVINPLADGLDAVKAA